MRPSTSPLRELIGKRDFYAGGLMVLLGLGVALKGTSYRAGTLMHMGPGFLPTALGVLLVLLGIAIAAAALSPSDEGHAEGQNILPAHGGIGHGADERVRKPRLNFLRLGSG